MDAAQARKICITPHVSGVGGMVTFREKLVSGLSARGYEVCCDLAEWNYRAVLVIGGTRHFWSLRRARQLGIPVVQRLDGMNWLHRRRGIARAGVRHYLRAEYGNLVLRLIRSRLATHIIYQSKFVRDWWERACGPTPASNSVIYNGVDLDQYTPLGAEQPPQDCWRVLVVEGSLMGGYELGLQTAVQLAAQLAEQMRASPADLARPVELLVAGRVPVELQQRWEQHLQQHAPRARLVWAGLVARQEIPALDRSAHLLYSADINAACPNSVIEALACGLPVLSFATGALPEMVTADAGRIVPYGGDPWRLEPPNVNNLARGALEILQAGEGLRRGARQRAEQVFGLDRMIEAYLDVLVGGHA